MGLREWDALDVRGQSLVNVQSRRQSLTFAQNGEKILNAVHHGFHNDPRRTHYFAVSCHLVYLVLSGHSRPVR